MTATEKRLREALECLVDDCDTDATRLSVVNARAAISESVERTMCQDEIDFESWWSDHGRFIDPDTEDVDWFDKRKELAGYAFLAARRPATSLMLGAAIHHAKERQRQRANDDLEGAGHQRSPAGGR